ncbi:MAG: hypothetical protein Q9165_001239 [Trypethelium subeluteriae]
MLSSPSGDRNPEQNINGGLAEQPTTNGSSAPAVGAAAVAQQPKVVQTAFIHKLYKRGDLVGLREIKRRASRHALIHRESFSGASGQKQLSVSQPPTPAEPMPDPVESRLGMLEHNLYEMHARLQRSEDMNSYLSSKCQMLNDGLLRAHQWGYDLSGQLIVMVPDPTNPIHRDVSSTQRAIAQQIEELRSLEESHDAFLSSRPPIFSVTDTNASVSPRQLPQDDSRRPSLFSNSSRPGSSFRMPVPPHIVSPRRYGSIGTGSGAYSPSPSRGHQQTANTHLPPPPPPSQHPLASVSSPPTNLPRRHTSADIRLHGWQGPGSEPNPPPPLPRSPFASGQNSTQWPSSPHRPPHNPGDQELRNALAAYEINKAPRAPIGSRQATPPTEPSQVEPSWNLPGARFPSYKTGGVGLLSAGVGPDGSAPPTRRSSMASNVHSLLNPAETAERAEEEELGPEEKKRKRVL